MIRTLFVSACLFMGISTAAMAQAVQSIEPADMLESPHWFWAKSLVFKDTLTMHPSGAAAIRIKGERFYEMKTKELGRCFATEEVRDEIKGLPLNKEYVLGGTVLTRDSAFSKFKKGAYAYVINKVIDQVTAPQNVESEIIRLIGVDQVILQHKAQRLMSDLLSNAQASLLTYSKRNNIEFSEMFDSSSEHSTKTLEIVAGTVESLNRNGEMKPAEVLAHFVKIALDRHFGGPAPEMLAEAGSSPATPTGPQEVIMRSTRPGEMLAQISIPHTLAVPPVAEETVAAVEPPPSAPPSAAPVEPGAEKPVAVTPAAPPSDPTTGGLHEETLKILRAIEGGDAPMPAAPKPSAEKPVAARPSQPTAEPAKEPAPKQDETLLSDLLNSLDATEPTEPKTPAVEAPAPTPVAVKPAEKKPKVKKPVAQPAQGASTSDEDLLKKAFAPVSSSKDSAPIPSKKPAVKAIEPKAPAAKVEEEEEEEEEGLFRRLFGNPVE